MATAVASIRTTSDLSSVRSTPVNRVAPTSVSRPVEMTASGEDKSVQDICCGFNRLCRRPTTPGLLSSAARVGNGATTGFDRSRSLTFNSTFNPCYTSTTPPDNDDDDCDGDVDTDDFNIDELISSSMTTHVSLPAVSEMSQSCIGGFRSTANSSSSEPPVAAIQTGGSFRPASWAGPPSGIVSSQSDYTSFALPSSTSQTGNCDETASSNLRAAAQSNRTTVEEPSSRSIAGSLPQVAEDVHYYWELESGPTLHLHHPSLMQQDFRQRSVAPIQMGTQMRLAENNMQVTGAASSQQTITESHIKSKPFRTPQMGRNAVMKPVGFDYAVDAAKRAGLVAGCEPGTKRSHQSYVVSSKSKTVTDLQSSEGKFGKPHRCPTPPRILSPCIDGGEPCEVTIAEI